MGQGQTLDELAQNATETNERKITQLRDNTGLQGSVAFSSLIVFPASATIVAAETASDPASPIATTVRVALSAAALGLACAASASVRLAVAAASVRGPTEAAAGRAFCSTYFGGGRSSFACFGLRGGES